MKRDIIIFPAAAANALDGPLTSARPIAVRLREGALRIGTLNILDRSHARAAQPDGRIAHIMFEKKYVGHHRPVPCRKSGWRSIEGLAMPTESGPRRGNMARLDLAQQKTDDAVPRSAEAYDIVSRLGRAEGIAVIRMRFGQILAAESERAHQILRLSAEMFIKLKPDDGVRPVWSSGSLASPASFIVTKALRISNIRQFSKLPPSATRPHLHVKKTLIPSMLARQWAWTDAENAPNANGNSPVYCGIYYSVSHVGWMPSVGPP
jgi:hypothetical protein